MTGFEHHPKMIVSWSLFLWCLRGTFTPPTLQDTSEIWLDSWGTQPHSNMTGILGRYQTRQVYSIYTVYIYMYIHVYLYIYRYRYRSIFWEAQWNPPNNWRHPSHWTGSIKIARIANQYIHLHDLKRLVFCGAMSKTTYPPRFKPKKPSVGHSFCMGWRNPNLTRGFVENGIC